MSDPPIPKSGKRLLTTDDQSNMEKTQVIVNRNCWSKWWGRNVVFWMEGISIQSNGETQSDPRTWLNGEEEEKKLFKYKSDPIWRKAGWWRKWMGSLTQDTAIPGSFSMQWGMCYIKFFWSDEIQIGAISNIGKCRDTSESNGKVPNSSLHVCLFSKVMVCLFVMGFAAPP